MYMTLYVCSTTLKGLAPKLSEPRAKRTGVGSMGAPGASAPGHEISEWNTHKVERERRHFNTR